MSTMPLHLVPPDPRTAAADAFLEATHAKKEADAVLKLARAAMLELAVPERNDLLRQGQAVPSIRIHGSTRGAEEPSVLVVWRPNYRPSDTVTETRARFGDRYSELCEEHDVLAMAKGATLEQLAEVVGDDAAMALIDAGLLTLTTLVSPRKGAPDQVAKLYAKRDPLASALHDFVDNHMPAPQVRKGK